MKMPGAGNDAARPDRENAAFRGRRAQLRTGEVVALDNPNLSLATDTPIKVREQDLIGRIPFAERLADILKSAAGPESLVIGLYGPWGSGKTSVINLVENALSRKDDDRRASLSSVLSPGITSRPSSCSLSSLRKSGVRLIKMHMGGASYSESCALSAPRSSMPSRHILKPC